jgi:MFS family permease
MVMLFRNPDSSIYRSILLLCRFLSGFVLGFAEINFFTILLDLFGASLQSALPHEEILVTEDPRRDGGGMGMWLGLWTWCSVGSIAIGFTVGAVIINNLNPQWGFYITVILTVVVLFINIITPETRRSHYRRSSKKILDEKDHLKKLIGRGEIKLHISTTSPT